jgi:hypothetical protein
MIVSLRCGIQVLPKYSTTRGLCQEKRRQFLHIIHAPFPVSEAKADLFAKKMGKIKKNFAFPLYNRHFFCYTISVKEFLFARSGKKE